MKSDKLIQIRVSEKLKGEMQKRAKDLNMTLSAYIIFIAQKDLGKI